MVNWLIYYREKLFNKTFEQLVQEREQEKLNSDNNNNNNNNDGNSDNNINISDLPSERLYQKLRLDESPSE